MEVLAVRRDDGPYRSACDMKKLMPSLLLSLALGAAAAPCETRVLTAESARPYEKGFARDGGEIVVDNSSDDSVKPTVSDKTTVNYIG